MTTERRRQRESFLPWIRFAGDVLFIYLCLQAAFWLRFSSGHFASEHGTPDYSVYRRLFHLIAFLLVIALRRRGLYKAARQMTFYAETVRVLRAVISTLVLLMAASFFVRDFTFSRSYLVLALPVLAVGVTLWRFLLGTVVLVFDQRRGSLRNVLVVGYDDNARRLTQHYRRHLRLDTRVMAYLDDAMEPGTVVEGVPILGRTADLGKTLRERREVHEVVLSRQDLSKEAVLAMMLECEKEFVTFRWTADLFGLIASKVNISTLGGVSLLSTTDSPLAEWENRALKRLMDIFLSAAVLVFGAPLLLFIAWRVKHDSPGPVFYGQERVGEDGRRFTLYKFRTMKVGAEDETGPVWASADDPRRTPFGAFLRRTNLDELPQFWNALWGDMSLVGPRPERPVFVDRFKENIPRYMARHTIRSGITGWAQVNGLRGNTSIEERTKYDLFYIENWSLVFDVKILFKTFFARENAY